MANPSVLQIVQYLKDLSFENFTLSIAAPAAQPALDLNVNVAVQPVTEPVELGGTVTGEYESALLLRAAARPHDDPNGKPFFVVEITYAARYRLADVPKAEVEPFLAIEAPRLLFPFARQIVADAVANGGLPPLLLAPMDFAQIYAQRRQAT